MTATPANALVMELIENILSLPAATAASMLAKP